MISRGSHKMVQRLTSTPVKNELDLRMSRLRGRWARTQVSCNRYAVDGAMAACNLVRIIEARGYATKSIKLLGLQILADGIQTQSTCGCQQIMIPTHLSDRITLSGSGTKVVAEIGERAQHPRVLTVDSFCDWGSRIVSHLSEWCPVDGGAEFPQPSRSLRSIHTRIPFVCSDCNSVPAAESPMSNECHWDSEGAMTRMTRIDTNCS